MIDRDVLRELAAFHSPEQAAVSFYFQPQSPRDQSHREETILVRDLVREAQRNGHGAAAYADLERIARLAEHLNGNHSRAKAIFACEARGIWREFDLPARLTESAVQVNRRFHLKPLSTVLEEARRTSVALIDRRRARIFDVWADEIGEVEDFIGEIPRLGKSEGFAGFEAAHAERHAEQFAMRHYQNVSDRLLRRYANGSGFNALLIGCRDEIRAEILPHLHTYLRDVLLGTFSLDVATASPEDVKEKANAFITQHRRSQRESLVREALGQAQRNGTGAAGLRNVLQSLERGEVQAVLIGRNFAAPAVECTNCGYVDSRMVRECAACGQPTTEVEDASDALIALALRNGADVVYVSDDAEFERAGNVAALLRFRADQNTEGKKAS
jgi:peptide subunit release factor 1 (eRF1)